MAEIGQSVKAGATLVGKVYKGVWLLSIIGIIVVLGGFYLEFRKLTDQVAKVESMVNAIGEKVMGATQWKEKADKQLDELKEKAGGLMDKLGK